MAQGVDGNQVEAVPDQESLLPPEVVPLDPQAASRLSQSQADTRSIGMSTPEAQNVPGLATSTTGTVTPGLSEGMQSAQDFRRDMYNSLMGNKNAQPLGSNPNQNQNQAASQYNPSQFTSQQGSRFQPQQQSQNNAPSQLTSQQPAFAQPSSSQPSSPGVSPWMSANGQVDATQGPAQTQSLSGNVKYPTMHAGSSKGLGVAHAVSTATMLGMGLGSLFLMKGPGRYYMGGMMGLGLMNYGMRNAFRF